VGLAAGSPAGCVHRGPNRGSLRRALPVI
jgi:hypothetical protein